MNYLQKSLSGLCALSLCGAAALAVKPETPALTAPAKTPKRPVTDEFHGQKVVDEYRWLEDFADPAVHRSNDEQNRYTRSVLDRNPALPAIRDRVKELISASSSAYFSLSDHHGVLFAMKFQPPRDQPLLVTLK
jgi:prolyl oligopeptidase